MQIKDSGERALFDSGAVRDISKGKGRLDLVPLSVVAKLMKDKVITYISYFQSTREPKFLYQALEEVRIMISGFSFNSSSIRSLDSYVS